MIIHKMRLDKGVYTEFEIINFEFETETEWAFLAKPIATVIHGKRVERNENPKIICFSKKRRTGEQTVTVDGERHKMPVTEICNPPSFYNVLRNRAIDEGKLKLQGDEAPPLDDRDLFT